MPQPDPAQRIASVAHIIQDAGGRVVGRTRLQKLAYLLELAGVGDGFEFEYRHYGPFSQELADTATKASLLGTVDEEEHVANWGGVYSIFTAQLEGGRMVPKARLDLARLAAAADPIELELAATAAFLNKEFDDPWAETARRKPSKIGGGKLQKAKQLYAQLEAINTPSRLPKLT